MVIPLTEKYEEKKQIVGKLLNNLEVPTVIRIHRKTGITYNLIKKIADELGYETVKEVVKTSRIMYVIRKR